MTYTSNILMDTGHSVVMDTGKEAIPDIESTVALPEPSAAERQAMSVLNVPPRVDK
jgi:hypothetical protein